MLAIAPAALGTAVSVAKDLPVVGDVLGAIGGIFGFGGPEGCEKYFLEAAQAAERISPERSFQAWQSIGVDKAASILKLGRRGVGDFCTPRSDLNNFVCEGGNFDPGAHRRTLRRFGLTMADIARANRAMGIPHDGRCKAESPMVAAIGLSKGRQIAERRLDTSGADVAGAGVDPTILLIGGAALGSIVLLTREG